MMTIAEALWKVEKLTELHSFCWEEIPGNDSDRFIDFLKLKFGIDWIKTAKIKKVDNRKIIIISTEKNSLSLRRSNENPRTITLEIDDGRTENFFAYEENPREHIMSMHLSVDVGPSLYKSGRVIIDERRILRGIQYCIICGGMAMMGIITVKHEDGREVSFDPKLYHYVEVGHPITNDDINLDTMGAIMADAWNMDEMLNPAQLEEDAIYLGILTARGIKPLSRLEYFVKPHILDILKDLELIIVPITRFAEDGMKVRHFIIGKNQNIIEQYIAEFEGTVLQEKIPSIVRSDAMYFGYPECCAEAYIKELYTSNNICNEEKSLLFHYACPGCKETPRLIPLYKSALLEARHLFKKIPSFNKDWSAEVKALA